MWRGLAVQCLRSFVTAQLPSRTARQSNESDRCRWGQCCELLALRAARLDVQGSSDVRRPAPRAGVPYAASRDTRSTTSTNWKERSTASMPPSLSEAAIALHRRAIIVDGHCDTPYRMLRHNVRLHEHDPEAQCDLDSLRESGITASFFA